MKKHYKFLSVFALLAGTMMAQQVIPCYTDEAMRDLFAKDPAAKARFEAAQNEPLPANFVQRYGNNITNSVYYTPDTIPVVVHILHQGGPENVSDATIYGALAEVNRIHQKRNSDTTGIDPYFQPIAGRNNYVFVLATKDPNGNCTNGIVRHYDSHTNWSQSNPGYSYTGTAAGKWNPTKYLNIYIVSMICSTTAPCSQSGGIVVGYTYLPGTWPTGDQHDAIVYNYQFLTGTNARSLAHEVGHWLGLPHTFGNTNNPGGTCSAANDDVLTSGSAGAGVTDDTPPTVGAFSTCPASTSNTCYPTYSSVNYANVQNIMDYSSCPKNFTEGQCKRMHNTMGLGTSGRSNVCTAANKIATGVRYPQICAPNAFFKASTRVVCPNTIVTFSDSSNNAHPTSWHWSFPGGTLYGTSTVNDSMPKVTYATPGTYAVSYTATTVGGSGTITANSYITVVTNVATYTGTWSEGFESATLPGSDWNVFNTGGSDWNITSNAAATGLKSAWIDNTMNNSGDVSTLESTSFSLVGLNSPKMTLKLAYRQQTSTDNDKFQVFASNDCGASWTVKMTRSGSTMATVTPPSTTPFVPASSNFMTYTVNLTAYVANPNVRFRFVFSADPTGTGGVGNNIYLDDINLYDAAPTGIENIEEKVGLSVYPNPSSGKINLDLSLTESHEIGINVTDVLGRTIESIPAKNYGTGDLTLSVAEKKVYAPGVYIVNVEVDGKKITRKVLVQ